MKRISVIISGMPSVGKTTAANAIASKFKLKLVAGGDMLKEIAMERGYAGSGSEWWDGSEGMRFLSERKSNPDFDREVDRRLLEKVRRGGVVVTSYTIPWLTNKKKDGGLKIWFAANQRTRARRLASRDKISFSKALPTIRRRDLENRRLYAKLYGIKFGEDLSVFNYVVETDNLSALEVADISCRLVAGFKSDRTAERRSPISRRNVRMRLAAKRSAEKPREQSK